MSRAVCPGSFDPVTHGHLDVIGRTSRLVDEVVVAVGNNVAKNALFSPQERVEMLRDVTSDRSNVQVMLFDGLLVDFCSEQGAEFISKGLRGPDFDYELQMAQMNRRLSGVDTVFLPTGAEWAYVSSSLVREIASLGGDITPFVPASVADRISRRLAERNRDHGRAVRDL